MLPGDGGVSLEEGASAPSSARQAPSSALFYNPFDHTGDLAEVFDEEEGVDEWEEYGSGEAESSAPRVRDQGKGGTLVVDVPYPRGRKKAGGGVGGYER